MGNHKQRLMADEIMMQGKRRAKSYTKHKGYRSFMSDIESKAENIRIRVQKTGNRRTQKLSIKASQA
jgi:predicted glycosyltransferase involved in capsule biosynthesis